MTRTLLVLLAVGCLVLGACGGKKKSSSTTQQPSTRTAQQSTDATDTLQQAIRGAVRDNNRLAGYVLWHNVIPSWATDSTRGPALSQLRESTADAVKARVRVRTLSSHYDILDVRLDPSYARASVTVRQQTRVRVYRNGRVSGGAKTVNETARLELHRIGDEERFVVWEVR